RQCRGPPHRPGAAAAFDRCGRQPAGDGRVRPFQIAGFRAGRCNGRGLEKPAPARHALALMVAVRAGDEERRTHGDGATRRRRSVYKHILIATDGSELAARGVTAGLGLAAKVSAAVTLLSVVEPLSNDAALVARAEG